MCRDELDANLLAAKIAAEGHKGPRCRRYVSHAKPPVLLAFYSLARTVQYGYSKKRIRQMFASILARVSDPDSLNPDPDPGFWVDLHTDPGCSSKFCR